jgi:hypothetical protein
MAEASGRALRNAMLATIYLAAALYGVKTGATATQTGSSIVMSLCIGILMTLFAAEDSRVMGRPLPHTARWIVYFLWPIAVPVVVLRTRGAKGLPIFLLHVFLIVLTYSVCMIITEARLHG